MSTWCSKSEPQTREVVATFVFVETGERRIAIYYDDGIMGRRLLARKHTPSSLRELTLEECQLLATQCARHPFNGNVTVTEEMEFVNPWELRQDSRVFRVVCETPVHLKLVKAVHGAYLRPHSQPRALWWTAQGELFVEPNIHLHAVLLYAEAHPERYLLDHDGRRWMLQRPREEQWRFATADEEAAIVAALTPWLLQHYVFGKQKVATTDSESSTP